MKNTGIIKQVDDLGRLVIPNEIRKFLGLTPGKKAALYLENNKLIVQPYEADESGLPDRAQKVFDDLDDTGYLSKKVIILTDRNSKIVASNKKEYINITNEEIRISQHPFEDKNILLSSSILASLLIAP